ncbi:MAG: HAMP domain-containing protein [Nitrospinota bacterium]|nr:MAG: HAMP domain-containing protein [Nitrospinota bacterium]
MRFYQTFRFRLTVQYILVLSFILCLFSLGVYFGLQEVLYRNLDASLWSIAESEVASAFDAPDASIHFHELEENPLVRKETRFDKFVQIRTFPTGRLVGKSQNLGSGELPLNPQTKVQLALGEVILETIQTPSSPPIRLISLPVLMEGEVQYIMQVGASLAPIQTTLARLFWLLLVMDGSALLFTGLGGAFLARRALQPIHRIVHTVEQIESKNLDQRLKVENPADEIGRLAGVLNRMLDRLERSFRSQQRFIADASHELRSPLANLRMALELTLRRPRQESEYRETLHSALEEVDRLVRLVNGLLTLSRADSDRLEVSRDPVPLQPLLQQVLVDYQLRAKDKGIALSWSLPQVAVRGNRERLYQLFANLLDNALRYTPEGGEVTVCGEEEGERVLIRVVDTGIGIAPEHLPHIFERFYRVDKERSRAEGGSGLGLAICQEIVRAHGGSLHVESSPGKGSTFTVALPLFQTGPAMMREF